ncbi:tRNA (5-methylaminomethyl-2-thiouridine)(34)-methyltransferase MnmD [Paragemmobacter straminiformis]|uniref:tRNA (5-methylaminomethyl-2-thiouridine)(34)-methyltransferase MnmD n=1 Tax=Paragemmobacter straminiformis TaxID=2045119 RepID=A0A842IDE2_9RHOB|nr:tRNA (5-methylaminomethyl-2-thiouridine)(34)-methyltransferase MnmD [Gemmobacter straminiformis]MBC2837539.1 tRNA (5-methylaminomethyl-2-thiouridine)(34)-methyltransferase MnmD [Gemmobacter straminiformis]
MGSGEQGADAGVAWKDGVIPVSTRFDDPYFSLADGLAETRHVFLAGNGLPDRLADGFHVAELGFGTGLNLLALLIAWTQTGRRGGLRYTSFEAYPLPATDIARALRHFPEAHAVAGPFLSQWDNAPAGGVKRIALAGIEAQVILGDARDTLPAWQGRADAWFLDGFSPAKNPELWSPEIMAEVGRHTAAGGSFATYTAAGHVRRSLEAAGFAVTRQAGHGRKRHMTTGTKV